MAKQIIVLSNDDSMTSVLTALRETGLSMTQRSYGARKLDDEGLKRYLSAQSPQLIIMVPSPEINYEKAMEFVLKTNPRAVPLVVGLATQGNATNAVHVKEFDSLSMLVTSFLTGTSDLNSLRKLVVA